MVQTPMKTPLGNQRGAVLITGLVIMLIMTLLGLAAMQSTTLQEKMAGNLSNRNLAFQASEAALREGESFLMSSSLPAFDGTNGLYQPLAAPQSVDWSSSTASKEFTGNLQDQDGLSLVAESPRYLIEDLGAVESDSASLTAGTAVSDFNMYRITARGVGSTTAAQVILQSTYLREN